MPTSSTNLKNRVKKLYLPRTKPLLPLFEVISNSIHAIQEINDEGYEGKILIETIRNGSPEALIRSGEIEKYPINSFRVIDNGIGLNKQNFISFSEFDSDKKASIGGKGVGRLVCLKAFRNMQIESIYQEGDDWFKRVFIYKKSKTGFDKYNESKLNNSKRTKSETKTLLSIYEDKYQKTAPKTIGEIAREIVTHFQLYFIQNIQPEIIIRNQDNTEINLTNLFHNEFEREVLDNNFKIGQEQFTIYISKSHKDKSHKIHYCAHERTVKNEGLSKYINDLKFIIANGDKPSYYYQVFVISTFLNENVNESRTGFNFSSEDDEEIDLKEITLSKIRKATILSIEYLLRDFLSKMRKEKMEKYIPVIQENYPNYYSVLNYKKEEVEKLPIGLSKEELDIKLYEIESKWRVEVKTEGIELLERKKDIQKLDEYEELYNKFLTEFNDIGQSDLARYVVHRRSVIDLLDHLIGLNEDEKFANEDIVHSLFFPIRETDKTIETDKQNLWLLDERLTFNSFLASDKLFKQVDELSSDSHKRMDVIIKKEEIFENASLFAENKFPFESFTIIEFKRPERDDYKQGDIKHDPVKQVRMYIEEVIDGKAKQNGKAIKANKNTPFYCYIVADITPSLLKILKYESFDPTPDGIGYFKFFTTETSKAYIEVLPFQKVIKDAKQRNRILFDKLKMT
jgi:hypothetical protein